jgi:hypothetical protein
MQQREIVAVMRRDDALLLCRDEGDRSALLPPSCIVRVRSGVPVRPVTGPSAV